MTQRGAADGVPALSIRNLRVDYGEFTAVDDLNLELRAGEIFGLAGPNGAGKTSTIRVVASLLRPTYGEVDVCGMDLFESPRDVHGVIGYMPDLAPVIADLKVWEFLDLYAHSYGLRGRAKRERVDRCLEQVKLAEKRDTYGRGLSRGMMQRVVLAKTLLHRPRLLLLDEPASGMDPVARRDLREILEGLAADGATVVVSSHILSELSGMCSSAGIMHLGKMVRHGSMRDLSSTDGSECTDIEIEVYSSPEEVTAWLADHDRVSTVRRDGNHFEFSFTGDQQARSQLLAAMVRDGFELGSFTPRRSGIESMLMDLLEGDSDE